MARSDNDPTTERQELLERIWIAEAKAFATILEETPAKELTAATLNSARQFLGDQGVRLETLEKEGRRRGKAGRVLTDQIAAAVKADAEGRLPLPKPDLSKG